jgi:hypothetical protein
MQGLPIALGVMDDERGRLALFKDLPRRHDAEVVLLRLKAP